MDDTIRPASRVFQLEAHNLDYEFNKLVDQHVESLDIPLVSEEVKLLLKLYIFGNHIKNYTTVGLNFFNLALYDSKSLENDLLKDKPRSYKLVLLAACNLVLPYVLRSRGEVKNRLEKACLEKLKLPWLNLENMAMTLRSLNILNFLVFLWEAKYLHLQNRLVGIMPGLTHQDYCNNVSINKAQMELINRDIIWRALAEFLSTILPYINKDSIKNHVLRLIGLIPKMNRELKLSEKFGGQEQNNCAICGKQPFNPLVIGCRHVFCYYCLHSRYLSDQTDGYVCLLCKYSTRDQPQVQRPLRLVSR